MFKTGDIVRYTRGFMTMDIEAKIKPLYGVICDMESYTNCKIIWFSDNPHKKRWDQYSFLTHEIEKV